MSFEENFIVTQPILEYWIYEEDYRLEDLVDDINFEDVNQCQKAISKLANEINSIGVQKVANQLLDVSLEDQIAKYVFVFEYKGVTRGIVYIEDYYNGTIDFKEKPIELYPIYEPVQVIKYKPKLLN